MASWAGAPATPTPRTGRDRLLVTELTDDEPLLWGTKRSVGIPAHLERGLEHDQAVGQDRAALDVEEVMAELPGGAQIRAGVAAAKLRPAGDARLDEMPAGGGGGSAVPPGKK